MPEVARPRVGRSNLVVPAITTGHDSKRANGRKRTGLRAAQGVVTVAVADQFAFQFPWQVDMPRERVPWLLLALPIVAVALGPTCIITTIPAVLSRCLLIASRTAAECLDILVIATGSDVGLPPVVSAIAVVGGVTVPAIRVASMPLVVARVVIARVIIEHAAPPVNSFTMSM
jgi:hypothetical protein